MALYVDLRFLNSTQQLRHETLIALEDAIADILAEGSFSLDLRNALVDVELSDEVAFKIPLNGLVFSLMLIPSRFAVEDYKFSQNDFIFASANPKADIAKYFDESIQLAIGKAHIQTVTRWIEKSITNMARRTWNLSYLEGNTVNMYDLVHLANANPEVNELLNFQSNENSQFSEIEKSVELKTRRLIEILTKENNETCLHNMISTISEKQFQQVFVNISLKPDLYGDIIERPINTSFIRGMRDATDYFVNATGARKALVVNAREVRLAGYLSRKLALLLIATQLATDVDTCGTPHLLKMHIPTKEVAERFTNRFYKTSLKDKEFKYTAGKNTTADLIGKTLYFASPATCNLQGNKICRTCYGRLSDVNQFHIGLYSVLVLTEQITQMLD